MLCYMRKSCADFEVVSDEVVCDVLAPSPSVEVNILRHLGSSVSVARRGKGQINVVVTRAPLRKSGVAFS